MNENIKVILEKISKLEDKLQEELDKEELGKFDFIGKKVCFNSSVIKEHQQYVEDLFSYIKNAPLLYIVTAPIIYSLIIPAVLMDIMVSIYQHINFRVYHISIVKRKDYIVFDRGYLAYLNPIEKLNCLYCSYFNGLIAYVAEVSARTEQFWCPIKHAKKIAYRHSRYNNFLPYGDAKAFRKELTKLREELKKLEE